MMLLSATCTACTKYEEHRYKHRYVQSSKSVGRRCWSKVLVGGVGCLSLCQLEQLMKFS